MNNNNNVTLEVFNSKKWPFIYLTLGILCFIVAIFIGKEDTPIFIYIIALLFLIGFIILISRPYILMKVIDDKKIYIYKRKKEYCINIQDIKKIKFRINSIDFTVAIFANDEVVHINSFINNQKIMKIKFLDLMKRNNIHIEEEYSDISID